MKKTYIMPNCRYAELDNTIALLADSGIGKNDTPIEGEGDILSRDMNTTGGSTNLWDQEW